MVKKSEFGKGFTYCIGLFLAHEERARDYKQKNISLSLWMYGAADHLFELVIPSKCPKELRSKIREWLEKCVKWRFEEMKWEDAEWAIQTAKDILREWDIACGIKAIKGSWE